MADQVYLGGSPQVALDAVCQVFTDKKRPLDGTVVRNFITMYNPEHFKDQEVHKLLNSLALACDRLKTSTNIDDKANLAIVAVYEIFRKDLRMIKKAISKEFNLKKLKLAKFIKTTDPAVKKIGLYVTHFLYLQGGDMTDYRKFVDSTDAQKVFQKYLDGIGSQDEPTAPVLIPGSGPPNGRIRTSSLREIYHSSRRFLNMPENVLDLPEYPTTGTVPNNFPKVLVWVDDQPESADNQAVKQAVEAADPNIRVIQFAASSSFFMFMGEFQQLRGYPASHFRLMTDRSRTMSMMRGQGAEGNTEGIDAQTGEGVVSFIRNELNITDVPIMVFCLNVKAARPLEQRFARIKVTANLRDAVEYASFRLLNF